MGPLADFRGETDNKTNSEKLKIKWLDNCENNKERLETNKSEEDLIYQENPPKQENHRITKDVKSIMKPFQIENFNEHLKKQMEI